MPILPKPRGELSAAVLGALLGPVVQVPMPAGHDAEDEDLQLALYCCYELHYRGFDGVDPEWEWEPSLLALRRELERRFVAELRGEIGDPRDTAEPGEMDLALRAIADADDSPSVSRHVERHATLRQLEEFLVHKSAYQLKEADPHTFALPRLSGPPKAAFAEIQADEYGSGRPDRLHADLYAKTLREMGLDDTYGAYLDRIPGVTLAPINLVSLFGLHRRWRGAAAGHLALFEMGSSLPSGRYARGMRRLGCTEAAIDFFDEHVLADAVHENIAAVDLAGGLARLEPELTADILWGARASVVLDGRQGRHLMGAWEAGRSSLSGEQAADGVEHLVARG